MQICRPLLTGHALMSSERSYKDSKGGWGRAAKKVKAAHAALAAVPASTAQRSFASAVRLI